MNADGVFLSFVTAINDHDVRTMVALMTGDHLFVDSVGNRTAGIKTMEAAWKGYFGICPDFWLRADNVVSGGDVVLAVGEAGGSIDDSEWRTPAAWKAVVREGKVAEWRVFADNKPVYEILARR